MIEMENLTKSYGKGSGRAKILKGISLFVPRGDYVSIMGPSGSGKSTLAAILGCLSTPDTGVYRLDGANIAKMSAGHLAKLRNKLIGYIFQDFNLLDGLSALDNVSLPLIYAGVGYSQRRRRALECLKAVGLENRASHRPNQLSGGQKQRVAIARALVNEPMFLFADEPTGALDKRTGQEILAIMQRLNLQGHTIVQVTHSVTDAAHSKRILHLVDGLIIRDEQVERPQIAQPPDADRGQEEVTTRLWRVAQYTSVVKAEDFPLLQRLVAQSQDRVSLLGAVRALVRWPNEDAADLIKTLFRHPDWVVRAEVVRFAGLQSEAYALPFYIAALTDDNAWIRHTAMTELRTLDINGLGDEARRQILAKMDDPDGRVRASVVFMVGRWRHPDAMGIVKRGMTDEDGRVRANAVDALKDPEMLETLVPDLVRLLDDKHNRVRANVAVLLFPSDQARSIACLGAMLHSESNLARASAAWALGVLRSVDGAHLLLAALTTETEEQVLNQVVRSLAKLSRGTCPLRDQILRVIGETSEDGQPEPSNARAS